MENKYRGLKIRDEIIIVENDRGQGYVVEPGNEKMLENAQNWAKKWNRDRQSYIHTYKNGEFDFELVEAADTSYSSGKLSFWNCNVTAPDGKTFLIGISSDLLLCLLKQNTFVNGKLDKKVYLGREGVKVGAFTTNMEEYKQSFEDENRRQTIAKGKKSNKYVEGDIVSTITTKMVYLGEVYWLCDVDHEWLDSINCKNDVFTIKKLRKPRKYHLFYNLQPQYPENVRDILVRSENKPSRFVEGHNDEYTLEKCLDKVFDSHVIKNEDGCWKWNLDDVCCLSRNEEDMDKVLEKIESAFKLKGVLYSVTECWWK